MSVGLGLECGPFRDASSDLLTNALEADRRSITLGVVDQGVIVFRALITLNASAAASTCSSCAAVGGPAIVDRNTEVPRSAPNAYDEGAPI